jgi:hypothetical protein
VAPQHAFAANHGHFQRGFFINIDDERNQSTRWKVDIGGILAVFAEYIAWRENHCFAALQYQSLFIGRKGVNQPIER